MGAARQGRSRDAHEAMSVQRDECLPLLLRKIGPLFAIFSSRIFDLYAFPLNPFTPLLVGRS